VSGEVTRSGLPADAPGGEERLFSTISGLEVAPLYGAGATASLAPPGPMALAPVPSCDRLT
jgi:hypothetical protein